MASLDILGIAGAAVILTGFVLNQLKILKTESFSYDAINLVGGIILVTYAWLIGSIPFVILNAVWLVVSLKDVTQHLMKRKA